MLLPELQQEIDKDASRYIRHSLKASGSVPSSPLSRTPSPKDSVIQAKIDAAFADIDKLAVEKCALAQTLIDLITRTRSRLDSDLAKVRFLQGETVDYISALGTSYSALGTGMADSYGGVGRNPSLQVSESLRNALTSAPTTPDTRQASLSAAAPSHSSASGFAHKSMLTHLCFYDEMTDTSPRSERRAAASSTKLSSVSPTKHRSASPTTTAPLVATQRTASRLSRQAITRVDTDMDEGDEDAEGEDAEGDDERLYCFCQKQSYGDVSVSSSCIDIHPNLDADDCV